MRLPAPEVFVRSKTPRRPCEVITMCSGSIPCRSLARLDVHSFKKSCPSEGPNKLLLTLIDYH